jgi:hypothetical protein
LFSLNAFVMNRVAVPTRRQRCAADHGVVKSARSSACQILALRLARPTAHESLFYISVPRWIFLLTFLLAPDPPRHPTRQPGQSTEPDSGTAVKTRRHSAILLDLSAAPVSARSTYPSSLVEDRLRNHRVDPFHPIDELRHAQVDSL